ncbi:MAG: OmpA family protein [Ignavibacteria bacterium]|jgi:outer membrane protein OmpA-like peptidoglycan-associated protein|nr:OmpA family protein [Ignavibacteria bacterium]MCU7504269.1 OmpA family protein [Ignavibacteria bacterium]MCU7516114.1 OmpA family protein [Ignavibacteria bacterium]
MKLCYIKAVLLIALFAAFSQPYYAQFSNFPIKIGFSFSALDPNTEFHGGSGLKWSTYSRGFLRIGLSEKIEGEIGGGYMKYAGLDRLHKYYTTNMYPIDLRVVYNPFDFESWNPYLSAGIGLVYWTNKQAASEHSPLRVDYDGFTRIIPLTAGAELKLTKELRLDLSIGYTHSFTNDLNGYKAEKNFLKNDGAFNLGAGLSFAFNVREKDSDMDGITNSDEKRIGTDPENPDTDADNLKDGEEVTTYKTNPLKADTDGDGLMDNEEVIIHKTNPNLADTDNDKLSDGEELLKYKTNPLMTDTDGDKLSDGEEVLTYKTNPLEVDTDKDGLTDFDEVQKYKTNPLLADTDEGGKNDGIEVNAGTNPLLKDDDVAKVEIPQEPVKEEVFDLEGILFASNSSAISPQAELILRKDLEYLLKHTDLKIQVNGHTDSIGKLSYNTMLSEKRAASVKNWLVKNGIQPERIATKGFGPKEPLAPNNVADGRKKNRRAELKQADL